jgi:hypothetical protein
MNNQENKKIVFNKKIHSLNPFGSFWDFTMSVLVFVCVVFIATLFVKFNLIEAESLISVSIGTFIGQAFTMIRQIQKSGIVKISDKEKLTEKLEKNKYKLFSGQDTLIYIKSVSRWARWDSDLIFIKKTDRDNLMVIAPAYIMKKL